MRVRLAVRAAILNPEGRVLMVNAYPGQQSDLWSLPGGGVEPDQSLTENLKREIREETGLAIVPGAPFLINEFHSNASGIRQVDIMFRAAIAGPARIHLEDPENIVNRFRWVSRDEMAQLRHKPDLLADAIWGGQTVPYDPDEPIII